MTGSSCRTSPSRSRRYRYQSDLDLAVAEGSPQGLALTPSVGSPRFPVPSSPYQAPDPQHRQSSYRGVESDTTPFHPTYSASNYPVSPTGTLTGNSHSYQTTGTSQFSSCSSWTSSLTADLLPSEAQVIPGPDMRYSSSEKTHLVYSDLCRVVSHTLCKLRCQVVTRVSAMIRPWQQRQGVRYHSTIFRAEV